MKEGSLGEFIFKHIWVDNGLNNDFHVFSCRVRAVSSIKGTFVRIIEKDHNHGQPNLFQCLMRTIPIIPPADLTEKRKKIEEIQIKEEILD